MPRPPRFQFPDAYYHIYNRGVAKMPIGSDDRDRRTFMQLLGETVQKFRLQLFAYCLMENHFHLFVQTPEANLEQAMWHFLSNYARFINLRYERVGPLFQGRYKCRLVETDAYAKTLARYIHRNPLEAGIAVRLEDYAWSSYACYVGKLPAWKWLETKWLLEQFDGEHEKAVRDFIEFHKQRSLSKEIKILERMGDVLGGVQFRKSFKRGQAPS